MNEIDPASPADQSAKGSTAASGSTSANASASTAATAGKPVSLPPDEEIGDEGIPQYDAGDDSFLRDPPPAAGAGTAAPQGPATATPAAPDAGPASP